MPVPESGALSGAYANRQARCAPRGVRLAPGAMSRWPIPAPMQRALALAQEAADAGEVPIGAVVMRDGAILGEGRNAPRAAHDPTAHAEIAAIRAAASALGDERLTGCELWVTLEPCAMCAGAIVQARMPRVVYGTVDQKAGACHTLYQVTSDPRLNHRAPVIGGVMAADSQALLREFFARKRAMGKK